MLQFLQLQIHRWAKLLQMFGASFSIPSEVVVVSNDQVFYPNSVDQMFSNKVQD